VAGWVGLVAVGVALLVKPVDVDLVVELADVGLVEEELVEDLDDVDELVDCDEVDVTLPVPTHSVRCASPVRLANRPASQSEPSQGFQACRLASVRL
jgi:hypothetical protein